PSQANFLSRNQSGHRAGTKIEVIEAQGVTIVDSAEGQVLAARMAHHVKSSRRRVAKFSGDRVTVAGGQ
ncbi:MAG TPA: hypothetical protein VK356_05370, partial [Thermomicrobiales bacterium]|nr:hypothetical protein [Thermomicrobiales bacterium]